MKALSLWEPWAILILLGLKKYETRSWSTIYRGDLVIHAAAKNDAEIVEGFNLSEVQAALRGTGITYAHLRFGVPVCVVRLVDVLPAMQVPKDERVLGNFALGRYSWLLDDVRPFTAWPRVSGKQGLWDFPDDLIQLQQSDQQHEPEIQQLSMFDLPPIRKPYV